MRRRILYAWAALFCIGLTILFLPSLFKDQVSEILKKEINENISADVTFTEASLNLWRRFPNLTLTLDNVTVAGQKEFKGDTLVKMKELHLSLATLNLLFLNQIEIRDLTFYDPDFHILVHANGQSNYDIFTGSPDSLVEGSGSVNLEMESWTIHQGKFLYDDRALGLRLTGEELSLDGRGEVEDNVMTLAVEAATKSFSTGWKNETYISKKDIELDLDITYDNRTGVLKFNNSLLKVNHLGVTLEGTFSHKENSHAVDIRFQSADSEFRDLLSLNNGLMRDLRKLDVKGHFLLQGMLKGTYNNERSIFPLFKIDLKVSDGQIKYADLPSALNNIQFDLVAENTDGIPDHTILDLKTFRMNFGKNPVEGSLTIAGLRDGYVKSDLIAKVKLQDLEQIFPSDSVSMRGDLDFALKADGNYKGSLIGIPAKGKQWLQMQAPAFQLSLNLTDGLFKYDHLRESISDINFHLNARHDEGTLDRTSVTMEKLEARLGDNPLKGFVHLTGFRNPVINSELTARLDLSELQNFLPMEGMEARGIFDMDMKISGPLNDSLKQFPLVNARLNLKNGFLRSDQSPLPMEKLHLILEATNETGRLRDTRLNIDTLTYSIDGENFFVTGQISDLERINYDLSVKGVLYLDKLNRILRLNDIVMAGEIGLDLETSGNYEDLMAERYHKLPTSGQIRMNGLIFQSQQIPHGLKVRHGHLLFTNEKIHLDTLYGSIGESSFSLKGHLTNYLAYVLHNEEEIRGDLEFQSEYFNLNELMRSEKLTRNDTAHHHLEKFDIPKNINFTFDAEITNLIYKELIILDLRGEVVLNDGMLSLKETDFHSLDAHFRIAGDYDTRDVHHPKFDLAVNVEDLDIGKAHAAFATVQAVAPASEHTYGVFSVDYSLKGELLPNMFPVLSSLQGGGTIRIREATINGMKLFHHISGLTKKESLRNPELKDIVMETRVENGTVFVKPFSMNLAGFTTDIEGRHELTGTMNYVLKIGLPPFDVVKIPLHVSGTYDKPKIHLGKGHEGTFDKGISSARQESQN